MLELDPNDPFDKLIIPIVETNRRKRADYAKDGDIYSNFRGVGMRTGTNALAAVETLIATKEERLAALEANGRGPANESVIDTYLDRAVYAILAYGLAREYEEAGVYADAIGVSGAPPADTVPSDGEPVVTIPVGSVPPWMKHAGRSMNQGDLKYYLFKDTSEYDYDEGQEVTVPSDIEPQGEKLHTGIMQMRDEQGNPIGEPKAVTFRKVDPSMWSEVAE